jgi:hypothetical protein
MRLPLEQRLRPLQKLVLRAFKALLGSAPGPVLIASYNKRFFGNGWARCMKEGMRSATEWSVGEVELFAAFVSRLNSCSY